MLNDLSLAAARSRSSWNDRLSAWENPASDNEEQQIERAAMVVREALAQNQWLSRQGVQIRPQGSYFNNTNVRLQADMDLHAWHPAIWTEFADDVHQPTATASLNYSGLGVTFEALIAEFRTQLDYELTRAIGRANVTPGNRAFEVRQVPGSRAPADVTPVFRVDYVTFHGVEYERPRYVVTEGVIILGRDGSHRLNFPVQHHANGIDKRRRTLHRYKRIVRCFKRLRDELVALGQLNAGQISSYFIECLLYLVDDVYYRYEADRWSRAVAMLEHLACGLNDDAWCSSALEVNGLKFLFHPSQSWSAKGAAQFVTAAHNRLCATA